MLIFLADTRRIQVQMLLERFCDSTENQWELTVFTIGSIFFGGIFIILSVRIINSLIKRLQKRRQSFENENLQKEENLDMEEIEEAEISIGKLQKIQDWAADFLSGKSKFGKPLVFFEI